MPDPDHIVRVFEQYTDALTRDDPDAAIALFAADAVVRDPVDGPVLEGATKIREFFAAGKGVLEYLRLPCRRPTVLVRRRPGFRPSGAPSGQSTTFCV